MKRILFGILLLLLRAVLWLRYRIKVEGLDRLTPEALNRPGGVLFLPNHPAYFIDPIAVTMAIWRRYSLRPMIVEYMYYMPIVNWVMRYLNALPVPNFHNASNSLKRKRNDKVFEEVISGLKRNENFLIYPAGRVKQSAKEIVSGASGVHRILQELPETNVVLVRTKGLWGSSFSRAVAAEAPTLWAAFKMGCQVVLKNLLFFTPRRTITISFTPAPDDFPRRAGRLDLGRYFDQWYNQPDGLVPTRDPLPGDSLVLVSYSMWGEQYLPLQTPALSENRPAAIFPIPDEVRQKVLAKLTKMLGENSSDRELTLQTSLTADLGFDSLDQAELVSFLQSEFDVEGVNVAQLTNVETVMRLAAKQIETATAHEVSLAHEDLTRWLPPATTRRAAVAPGKTLPEVFLNICATEGSRAACADNTSGVLTYNQMKLRVLLMAEYIATLPGKYIGVMLPASAGATILIFAIQLAGKIPLMVNWTMGMRHLDAIAAASGVEAVLTTWSFIDRLENVELGSIEDKLIMLEEVRRELTAFKKAKAWLRSRLSAGALLRLFPATAETAVLLFTSGTESLPKGVPLTHANILSNQRAVLETVEITTADVVYGILPPFHSFGFTVTSFMPLLGGVRVAYFPNPTDGKGMVRGLVKWGVTIVCGAPAFLRALVRAAQHGELTTLRLVVSGAEKAPEELFNLFAQHGKRDAVLEGYGITECSPALTFTLPGHSPKGVGRPIAGVELCIVHPDSFEPLPMGERGLILARGPNIFKGYLNPGNSSPFLTVKDAEWYKTGDLGYLDSEGNLHISGRQKRFIKAGGEMISLTAIEDTLQQALLRSGNCPSAEGPLLAVTAREEAGDKPKVTLFTRLGVTADAANQYLREAGFSNLVKVSEVVPLSEIPLLGSGKVNYRALETMLQQA